jgi:hypothetical protein
VSTSHRTLAPCYTSLLNSPLSPDSTRSFICSGQRTRHCISDSVILSPPTTESVATAGFYCFFIHIYIYIFFLSVSLSPDLSQPHQHNKHLHPTSGNQTLFTSRPTRSQDTTTNGPTPGKRQAPDQSRGRLLIIQLKRRPLSIVQQTRANQTGPRPPGGSTSKPSSQSALARGAQRPLGLGSETERGNQFLATPSLKNDDDL